MLDLCHHVSFEISNTLQDCVSPAMPMKRTPLKRKTPLRSSSQSKPRGTTQGMMRRQSKPKRKPRSKAEAARIYGPDDFRAWLHEQPCAVCGYRGRIEQAHAKGGGVGRKADFTLTLALCGTGGFPMWREGCHAQLHRVGIQSFEKDRGISLVALAELTQKRYAVHIASINQD